MSVLQTYADHFTRTFQEEEALHSFIREREDMAVWSRTATSRIRFAAIERDTPETEQLCQDCEADGRSAGMIEDTLRNTQLLALVNGEKIPVRSCAVKSILERAGVNGNSLRRVPKRTLAGILNDCIKTVKGETLIRQADDKVSAMLGGDASEYAVLPTPELFRTLTSYLQANYPGYTFERGEYSHSLSTGVWSFAGHTELSGAYTDLLAEHEMDVEAAIPAIRFTTSDVGVSGANLTPSLLLLTGRRIPLGAAIKMGHRNKATLATFEKNVKLLFAGFEDSVRQLGRPMDTGISYPYSTMLRAMKAIGIGKRLAYQAAELWKAQNPLKRSCTAYDLYLAICEVPFLLQSKRVTQSKVIEMEENVARFLKLDLEDYDLSGDYIW